MPRNGRWRVREVDADAVQRLVDACGISPVLSRLLLQRGVEDPPGAERFLRAGREDLHDPFRLPDMPKAVARVERAIAERQSIRIWGDYDADGLNGTAILIRTLRSLGAVADSYVPHRLREGYGLNAEGVQQALADGICVLITVDVGTTAVEPIRTLQAGGVDVIVVDHHEARNGESVAPAYALLNPRRADSTYPDRGLTASGLAFKFAQALCRHDPAMAFAQFDLACIGTVSDMGPLTGENRVVVREGLQELARTGKAGLRALIGVASTSGAKPRRWSPQRVGFEVGPLLNAAGRMGSAEAALQLLLTESSDEADGLVAQLAESNRQRQDLQKMIWHDALRLVEQQVNFRDHRIIVLASDRWHVGVVGIVAARLAGRFRRPVILCAEENGVLRGSGRSVHGFSLFDALDDCGELLSQYGGHHQACGMTLERSALGPLRQRLNILAVERMNMTALAPVMELDAELPLDQVSRALLEDLERLEPFGQGNPRPRFLTSGVTLCRAFEPFGRASHRGWVTDGTVTLEATIEGADGQLVSLPVGSRMDLVHTPAKRSARGETSLRLSVNDFQVVAG